MGTTRIVGLTGSIAMGKSTAARLFRLMGLPVFDADATVHALLAPGGAAVPSVLTLFPGVGELETGIDRRRLGAEVFGRPASLRALESVLHPRVAAAERGFLQRCRRRRAAVAVLDIPLLFERGGTKGRRQRHCDAVMVVSAPAFLQRQRALKRPGMTDARLAAILAQQMPDAEKRRRARYVIRSGLGLRFAWADIRRHLRTLHRNISGDEA